MGIGIIAPGKTARQGLLYCASAAVQHHGKDLSILQVKAKHVRAGRKLG